MSTPETAEPIEAERARSRHTRFAPGGGFVPIIGLAVVSFLLLAGLSLTNLPYGVSALGAERVLNGEVPYRDFWTIYAPGQFYLLAGLFALFGSKGAVSVLAGSLLNAITIALAYRLVWRLTERQVPAALVASIFLAVFLERGYYGAVSSYGGVICCVLVALNFFETYLDRGDRRFLVAAGLAAGIGAWFKHDVGAYGAIAMLVGLTAHHLARLLQGGVRVVATDLFILGASSAAAVLPVLLVVAVVAGKQAFQDLIVFPATIFPLGRPESYPSLLPGDFYDPWLVKRLMNWCQYLYFLLPFAAFLVSLPPTALAIVGRQPKLAAFGAVLAALFLFHYSSAHVQINTHIISMTLYAAGLSAVSLCVIGRLRPAWSGRATALALVVALGWLGTLAAPPFYRLLGHELLTGRQVERAELGLPKASRARLPLQDAENLRRLVRLVQEAVPPGEAVYVGPHRHDTVVIGWPHIYYLLDRPPATRYDEMEPGVVDTEPVQIEMVQSLSEKDVKVLVLVKVFSDEDLDTKKAIKQRNLPQVGATRLDSFIRSHYEELTQVGRFTIWHKIEN